MAKWDDDDEITAVPPTAPAVKTGPATPAASATPATAPIPEPALEIPTPALNDARASAGEQHASGKEGSGVIVEEPTVEPGEQFEISATKIGILGGREVGKSYFFQALVHSLIDSAASGQGVLGRYLKGRPPNIWHSYAMRKSNPAPINTNAFAAAYRSWQRLPSTQREDQRWYRLRMTFGTGLTGRKPWKLDVDFLDGSGEALELGLVPFMVPVWERAFGQASIMVFCLPLWVLFPEIAAMRDNDIKNRERILGNFGDLVNSYKEISQKARDNGLKVQTFLALTMADDQRGSLEALRRRWIEPLTAKTRAKYLKTLGRPRGVPQYLASARAVSKYLYKEIRYSEEMRVKEIPGMLTLEDPPWLFPVSAIDGQILSRIEADRDKGKALSPPGDPRPAHTELPLLAAMCDRHNTLM